MSRARPVLTTVAPLVAVVVALLLGRSRAVVAADPEPCQIALKGDSPVAKACAEGGVPRAKRVMKDLVRAAKERGMKTECTDCHKAVDEWKLRDGATDRFRKLIEASK